MTAPAALKFEDLVSISWRPCKVMAVMWSYSAATLSTRGLKFLERWQHSIADQDEIDPILDLELSEAGFSF